MEWFKLYAEFASDPKVQAMPEAMQRRLIMLYCLKCAGDLEKLDDDEVALALRISAKELEKTRDLFRRKGFIGDGWLLPNWDKRQEPKDRTAAERMRRIRERQREQIANVARNVAPVLRVEAEQERELDTECAAASRPRTREEPDYPDPDRSPLMISPGPHEIDEETSRQLWSLLWQGWQDESILAGFYQHQQFYKPESWREAIRLVASRKIKPSSIAYFEKIAADVDLNGAQEHKPMNGTPRASPAKPMTAAQAERERRRAWARES